MNDDAIWLAIDSERMSLADLLSSLSDAEWRSPSLCAGWTVRDVAAHLTLAPHITFGDALTGFIKARGSFNRMVYDTAVKQARRPVPELVTLLRCAVGSRRLAPGQKLKDALMDVLVHGQDIALPLGRTRPIPPAAAVVSADHLWQMGFPFYTRRRMRGLRLTATDVGWSVGSGAQITGPMDALLLLLADRAAGLPRLAGEGLAVLAQLP